MTAFTREIEAKLEGIAEPLHQVQFLLRELSALEARFADSPGEGESPDTAMQEAGNGVGVSQMYRVWECKIVVPHDAPMPSGFDAVPRRAAIEAVEAFGVDVVSCFSGWGGSLDETEIEVIENKPPKQD